MTPQFAAVVGFSKRVFKWEKAKPGARQSGSGLAEPRPAEARVGPPSGAQR